MDNANHYSKADSIKDVQAALRCLSSKTEPRTVVKNEIIEALRRRSSKYGRLDEPDVRVQTFWLSRDDLHEWVNELLMNEKTTCTPVPAAQEIVTDYKLCVTREQCYEIVAEMVVSQYEECNSPPVPPAPVTPEQTPSTTSKSSKDIICMTRRELLEFGWEFMEFMKTKTGSGTHSVAPAVPETPIQASTVDPNSIVTELMRNESAKSEKAPITAATPQAPMASVSVAPEIPAAPVHVSPTVPMILDPSRLIPEIPLRMALSNTSFNC